ncbi:MAG: NUDIX domain-containing protein [Pirellulaceae bacterium]|nr:NUDIX domain-containing protein [Pirellulaceae bacterium]
MGQPARFGKPRRGAVAIIVEDGRFLVIRRSLQVRAPDLVCFAGGTIEAHETPHQAIERELLEELSLVGTATDHVWRSVTSWGTELEWVIVQRHPDSEPIANPSEVAEWMWLDPVSLLKHPKLLPSVPAFFKAWAKNEFVLPDRAGVPNSHWINDD